VFLNVAPIQIKQIQGKCYLVPTISLFAARVPNRLIVQGGDSQEFDAVFN